MEAVTETILILGVAGDLVEPGDVATLDALLGAAQDVGGLTRFPGSPDPFLMLGDALDAMRTPVDAFAPRKGPVRSLSFGDMMAIVARADAAAPSVPPLHLIAAGALGDALDALGRFGDRVATDPQPLVALLSRERTRALESLRASLGEAPPSQRRNLQDHPLYSPEEMDANWRTGLTHRRRALERLDVQPMAGPRDIVALWQAATPSGVPDPTLGPLLDRPGCDTLVASFGLMKAMAMIGQAARFGRQGLLVVQY